ncbi:MAG: indole-3-glycerol phosphate synthase TrpC [Ignavibacteriales bacterium]|nr:indole-3-glycerol phosphate synthase TrpC [Ignavibacteriales bacterium]
MTILETILEEKRKEVSESERGIDRARIAAMARESERPRQFKKSLQQVPFALIAEIKKASPSKGTLLEDFDHRILATEFQSGGAAALSVLTDEKYFQGHPSYIADVKKVVQIPVLRKDFIVDEYQVFESRAIGADAILLIVRALPYATLRALYELAMSLDMDVLMETHTEEDIETANSIGAEIIGINNRDLGSFEVNISTSLALYHHVHSKAIAVSESGISSRADIQALEAAGFRAALVGEGIVTRPDRVAAVQQLLMR